MEIKLPKGSKLAKYEVDTAKVREVETARIAALKEELKNLDSKINAAKTNVSTTENDIVTTTAEIDRLEKEFKRGLIEGKATSKIEGSLTTAKAKQSTLSNKLSALKEVLKDAEGSDRDNIRQQIHESEQALKMMDFIDTLKGTNELLIEVAKKMRDIRNAKQGIDDETSRKFPTIHLESLNWLLRLFSEIPVVLHGFDVSDSEAVKEFENSRFAFIYRQKFDCDASFYEVSKYTYLPDRNNNRSPYF